METSGYIEHGGADDGQGEARCCIEWEATKTRELSILMERARRGEPGMSNKEIRLIARFDRK